MKISKRPENAVEGMNMLCGKLDRQNREKPHSLQFYDIKVKGLNEVYFFVADGK